MRGVSSKCAKRVYTKSEEWSRAMFGRILVPIEDTSRTPRSLEIARALAQRDGAPLVLLHVVAHRPSPADIILDKQELDRMTEALRAEGLDASYTLDFGVPASGISATAAENRCDLIVMSPGTYGGLERLLHRSVTESTAAHAPAPLLVWPERLDADTDTHFLRGPTSLVIVPLDGSEIAERALPFAVDFARDYGRPLLLLRVAGPVLLLGAGPETYRLTRQALMTEEDEARRYLAGVRERLAEHAGIRAECMVRQGDPAEDIIRTAEAHPGSLIVMSTHGRGGVARALLGSVATGVARATTMPLLVVPPEAARPERTAWLRDADAPRREIRSEEPPPADAGHSTS
jgi:nucleotide-binding universal stress UspA family protein